MKRKVIAVFLTAAMTMTILMEGAGSVAAAETNPEDLTGTVVIWDWDSTSQNKYVEKFNEVYPNVTV